MVANAVLEEEAPRGVVEEADAVAFAPTPFTAGTTGPTAAAAAPPIGGALARLCPAWTGHVP